MEFTEDIPKFPDQTCLYNAIQNIHYVTLTMPLLLIFHSQYAEFEAEIPKIVYCLVNI